MLKDVGCTFEKSGDAHNQIKSEQIKEDIFNKRLMLLSGEQSTLSSEA